VHWLERSNRDPRAFEQDCCGCDQQHDREPCNQNVGFEALDEVFIPNFQQRQAMGNWELGVGSWRRAALILKRQGG
jgi:hypothetical protein